MFANVFLSLRYYVTYELTWCSEGRVMLSSNKYTDRHNSVHHTINRTVLLGSLSLLVKILSFLHHFSWEIQNISGGGDSKALNYTMAMMVNQRLKEKQVSYSNLLQDCSL